MKEEIWKPIEGYEGLYEVSNLGRVKSLNYKHTGQEKIMKTLLKRTGYCRASLRKDNISKDWSVHRLVANAFIENPENLPEVNHKDENPSNNCVENLEWCDHKYNVNYGTAIKRRAEKLSTPIKCLDLETNKTTYFSSINEAGKVLGVYPTPIYKSIYKYNRPFKNRYIFSEVKN